MPYSIINFTGFDDVIEYNHCHHGVLECFDGAGIYGWVDPKGGSGGNLIRCNRIHDIVGYGIPWTALAEMPGAFQSPCFSWGIYLDDELCDTIVRGNVVYRAPGGMLLHGGWNTRVENNIFADASDEQIGIGNMQPDKYPAIQKTPAAGRPGSMSNNIFQRNIISYADPRPVLYFAGGWLKQAATFRETCFTIRGCRPNSIRSCTARRVRSPGNSGGRPRCRGSNGKGRGKTPLA